MGYSTGNLELNILGFSEKSVANIDLTAKALGRLASSIKKMNTTQFVLAGTKLEVLFDKIAKATNSINTNNINNLAIAAKSLASISKISSLDKMDFDKVGKGFENLSVAITPFVNKAKEAEASLVALDGILKKTSGKKIQGLLGGNDSNNKRGGLFGFAKLGINIYLMRRLGNAAADLVQAGSDYTETLNLWQVAMRDNLNSADEFINKMQKAYGISSKTLMNAQATFKNMIGSLGQISDATAYQLSEALVQMSADYASLYNRSFESAIQNMQSMLAGQVRPIRSAGLDITETTLFQFYQELGGTKRMRQLNRTEKQLLSILAVYKQMGKAGATGDMSKTINQFANQSRMMTEYWAELKTWSGLILKDWIDQNKILVRINASLILITEVMKSYAKSKGLGEENFLTGLYETVETTNEEVDELQGKLLDFDKFRALEDAGGQSSLAIDEKLLEAITGYSSEIDKANNEAEALAKSWGTSLGIFKDGDWILNPDTLANIKGKLFGILGIVSGISALLFVNKAFGKTWLGALIGVITYGYTTNEKFRESINKIVKALGQSLLPILDAAFNLLTPILEATTPIIEAVASFITMLDDLGLLEPIIWGITYGFIAFKGLKLLEHITPLVSKFRDFLKSQIEMPNKLSQTSAHIEKQRLSFKNLATAIGIGVTAFLGYSNFLDGFEGTTKIVISAISALVAALTIGAVAWMAYHGAMSMGVAVPVITAAVGIGAASIKSLIEEIPNYEKGASDIDSGTIFRAGEFGKTEAVYTASNGKTNVANVKQMEQAFYNALSRHTAEGNEKIVVQAYIDGEKVYENTTEKAKARGNVWAKA